jgi:hypothetical protein
MKAHTLAILCASLILTGCAVRIVPVPSPNLGTMERLNLTVGLLIPKAEAHRSTRIGGKTFETGNALKIGTKNTFKQIITDLVELETREQASTTPYLMVLLQPRVVSFQYDTSGQASVVLSCRMTDPKDRLLLDSTWYGSSSAAVDERVPQTGTAGGADTGNGTIERSCSAAFEAALKQMASSFMLAIHQTSFR